MIAFFFSCGLFICRVAVGSNLMVLAAVAISVVIIAGAHAYKAVKTVLTTDHEDELYLQL